MVYTINLLPSNTVNGITVHGTVSYEGRHIVISAVETIPKKYIEWTLNSEKENGWGSFSTWLKNCFTQGINFKEIKFQSINPFGPVPGANAGFAYFTVETGGIPSLVFLRNNAAAVLLFVRAYGDDNQIHYYGVLTEQQRIAGGFSKMKELLAGMIDGGSNFVPARAMAKEVKEEFGETIEFTDEDELTRIYRDTSYHQGIVPSAGGMCEHIKLYFKVIDKTSDPTWYQQKRPKILSSTFGLAEEGESIMIKFVDIGTVLSADKTIESMIPHTSDAKLLSAVSLWRYFELTN